MNQNNNRITLFLETPDNHSIADEEIYQELQPVNDENS